MADNRTKKEHYVPQCYLRNFAIDGHPDKIHVFDKTKAQIRKSQNILDNAYRTLMTRGMKGRYIYCTDLGMREYIRKRLSAVHKGEPSVHPMEA